MASILTDEQQEKKPDSDKTRSSDVQQAVDGVFSDWVDTKKAKPSVPPQELATVTRKSPVLCSQPVVRRYATGPECLSGSMASSVPRVSRIQLIPLALIGLGLFFGYRALSAPSTSSRQAVPATATRAEVVTINIEDIKVGQRIRGENPIREQAELIEPDPATWRKLGLQMTKEDGRSLWITLLRPLDWIESHNVKQGETIQLDLEEMGAVGPAMVLAVCPCPEIEPGEGAVVTGTFQHEAGPDTKMLNLYFEGEPSPHGVTSNHPYWSLDRKKFIPAGELEINERVDTVLGESRVVRSIPLKYTGYLYNIETTEHVFRVGHSGVLVHNSCPGIELERGMHITNKVGAGVARPPRHHIFPQEHRSWFEARNFDIDKVAVELDQGTHSALHTMGWNEKIMKELYRAEADVGRQLTPREIWKVGYGFLRDRGLGGLPFVPY